MLLHRTVDAAELNVAANDADVRPWLGGEGDLDLSELIAQPQNIALQGYGGGFFLQKLLPGLYEAHSLFALAARPGAIDAMREGLRYVFTHTDATEVVTKVPADNPAAKGLARAGGFERRFRRERAWRSSTGEMVAVDHYALPVTKWAHTDAACLDAGKLFHAQLEAAKARCGSALPVHDDDDAHDHAAGAAMLMAKAGQGGKAVASYNVWALQCGYQPIVLLSDHPVIVDVRDAIVGIRDGVMEVMSCR